jgi:hypothetical protein
MEHVNVLVACAVGEGRFLHTLVSAYLLHTVCISFVYDWHTFAFCSGRRSERWSVRLRPVVRGHLKR